MSRVVVTQVLQNRLILRDTFAIVILQAFVLGEPAIQELCDLLRGVERDLELLEILLEVYFPVEPLLALGLLKVFRSGVNGEAGKDVLVWLHTREKLER